MCSLLSLGHAPIAPWSLPLTAPAAGEPAVDGEPAPDAAEPNVAENWLRL